MKREKSQTQQGNFDQGSVSSNIFRLAWPMILAQLVGVLYNIIDRMFIGHLPEIGGLALTGLGVVFPFISFCNAFANWPGQGGSTIFAIERGMGEEDVALQILANSISLLLAMSAGLMLAGYLFTDSLLVMFGASDSTIGYARDYLLIYLLGTPFQLIALGLNPFVSALGFPGVAMATVVVGAVTNIILDPIFIYLLDLKIAGAAWATVLAQVASALCLVLFLLSKKSGLSFRFSHFKLKFHLVKQILVLGFANFVFQLTNSLTQTVCNKVLLSYGGDLQVGVMTLVSSIRQMAAMPINGLTGAAKPFWGYNYGAEKYDRIVQAITLVLKVSLTISLLTTLATLLFPTQLFRVFTDNQELIREGISCLQIFFIFFCFMSFQMVGQAVFTGLGFAKEATFFSLFRKVILVVPLTILLARIPWLGVKGVYLAEAISQLVGGIACFTTMWFRVARPLKAGQSLREFS